LQPLFRHIQNIIIGIIDFVHKPFSKWINKQTFRYLACGGGNTVLDIVIYTIAFELIFKRQDLHIAGIDIAAWVPSFMISFSITFPLGFILSRYIVFPESKVQSHVQLFRYFVLVCSCIALNYMFLKFFIGACNFNPILSKVLTTAIVAVFSYFSQRRYTFKVKHHQVVVDEDPTQDDGLAL
jgi:putative flippase GtrA